MQQISQGSSSQMYEEVILKVQPLQNRIHYRKLLLRSGFIGYDRNISSLQDASKIVSEGQHLFLLQPPPNKLNGNMRTVVYLRVILPFQSALLVV
jgi:hypothetical protein